MRTRFFRALLLATWLLCAAGAASAQVVATINMADKPVRLIRGAVAYKAINGSAVQKDDILETAGAGAQIEAGPNAIVALGPETKLYVVSLGTDDKTPTELALLQGWVKVYSKTAKRAQVSTSAIQAGFASGAAIIHSAQGKDELFADEGEQVATKLDGKGKAGPPAKVAGEQYAVLDAGKPLLVFPRPARDFLSQMPPSFRDRLALAPPVPKAGKVPPVKERDVDYADVEAWLNSSLAVRRTFVKRFSPRLADAEFRKQLDEALGQASEWKTVLHPPPATINSTMY